MALTSAQLQTLKAAINAETDPIFVQYRTDGNNGGMAAFYNENTSPAFIVYKSVVTTDQVGKAVNYIAVEAMTDANRTRITTFYAMNPEQFEPRSDVRTFWSNTFSGALGGQGQASRDALDALWRRTATKGEKLFATGTGTTASPAALGWEGTITSDDIRLAREA